MTNKLTTKEIEAPIAWAMRGKSGKLYMPYTTKPNDDIYENAREQGGSIIELFAKSHEIADTCIAALKDLETAQDYAVGLVMDRQDAVDERDAALQELEERDKQKPVGYFAGDKDGNILWSEDCVCEDAVYPRGDEDDEADADGTAQSIAFYTRPRRDRDMSEQDDKSHIEKMEKKRCYICGEISSKLVDGICEKVVCSRHKEEGKGIK